jgi:hypothetical protein
MIEYYNELLTLYLSDLTQSMSQTLLLSWIQVTTKQKKILMNPRSVVGDVGNAVGRRLLHHLRTRTRKVMAQRRDRELVVVREKQ